MPWTNVVFDSFRDTWSVVLNAFSVPLATDFQQSEIGIQIVSDDDSTGRKHQEEPPASREPLKSFS